MCGEICTDNRFEIIAAYKKKLIDCTNINSSPEEMAVIDNILFRFWQLDLLPPIPHGRLIDADALDVIGYCGIPQGREDTFDDGVMWLAEQIDLLPTIIPAEECE